MCAATCSRWWPTTATIRSGSIARAAARTWPIMVRPAMGCSTFMVLDFIRVPPPAASTTTVRLVPTQLPLRRPVGSRITLGAGAHPGLADQVLHGLGLHPGATAGGEHDDSQVGTH